MPRVEKQKQKHTIEIQMEGAERTNKTRNQSITSTHWQKSGAPRVEYRKDPSMLYDLLLYSTIPLDLDISFHINIYIFELVSQETQHVSLAPAEAQSGAMARGNLSELVDS